MGLKQACRRLSGRIATGPGWADRVRGKDGEGSGPALRACPTRRAKASHQWIRTVSRALMATPFRARCMYLRRVRPHGSHSGCHDNEQPVTESSQRARRVLGPGSMPESSDREDRRRLLIAQPDAGELRPPGRRRKAPTAKPTPESSARHTGRGEFRPLDRIYGGGRSDPQTDPGTQSGRGSVRSTHSAGGAPAFPEAITPPTMAQVVSTSPPTWAVVQNACW